MEDYTAAPEMFERLVNVGYYEAPAGRTITPVAIPPGTEYIEILTGGKVSFEVNGQDQVYGKGAIFWHLSEEITIHRTPPDDPYRCLVLVFKIKCRKRILPRVTQWHDEQSAVDFAREAQRCFHDNSYDREVLGKYLYNRVFWEAYCYTRRKGTPDYPLPVKRAMAIIDDLPSGDFPVGELAVRAGVSEPYLFALFKKYLYISPHQYILNRRLQKARTMLAGSEQSIKEIAFECGFFNLECFYRAFKKNCKFTPAAYRKLHSPYSLQ
jgi:AraC-like DNA-binding protein